MNELTIDELESVSGGADLSYCDEIHDWRNCPGQTPPTIPPGPPLPEL